MIPLKPSRTLCPPSSLPTSLGLLLVDGSKPVIAQQFLSFPISHTHLLLDTGEDGRRGKPQLNLADLRSIGYLKASVLEGVLLLFNRTLPPKGAAWPRQLPHNANNSCQCVTMLESWKKISLEPM